MIETNGMSSGRDPKKTVKRPGLPMGSFFASAFAAPRVRFLGSAAAFGAAACFLNAAVKTSSELECRIDINGVEDRGY